MGIQTEPGLQADWFLSTLIATWRVNLTTSRAFSLGCDVVGHKTLKPINKILIVQYSAEQSEVSYSLFEQLSIATKPLTGLDL